ANHRDAGRLAPRGERTRCRPRDSSWPVGRCRSSAARAHGARRRRGRRNSRREPRLSGSKIFVDRRTSPPVEGEALHQIPVGPVHAGIIEPGHFRFTASGETVVRLEQRLGYVHKGIEKLMTGATIERAAKLAARTSGDSTVAYGTAFAHAIEA